MVRNIGRVSRQLGTIPPGGYWPDLLFQNYSADDVPGHVGFRLADSLGRVFRLVKTSEVVVKGNMLTWNVTEVAVAATKVDNEAIGEELLPLDITITANAYNGGLLCLEEGTGAGALYGILENGAGTAGSSDADVKIEPPLHTALSGTDTAGSIINGPFMNVTQHNAADPCVEVPIGLAMWASTSGNPYIWAQTWGPCMLKAGTGAVGAGDTIGLAEDDAGSVQTLVTTEDPAIVGVSVQAIADGKFGLCILRCFP